MPESETDTADDNVEPAGPDDPEGPDLDDNDFVDVDEDMAAAVADETTSNDSSTSDEDATEETESDDSTSDTQSATETLTTGTSVGDMYCNALGMGATLARQQKGSGVDDPQKQMDEYGDLARQLELDKFVDEWVEEHGAGDELTPGQGVAIGTGMFAMAVLVEDPQMMENLQEAGS